MDWAYMIGSIFREMATNRLRRFLSILGVIIGTGAVIASLSVVEGGRGQIHSHLDKLGINIVYLQDHYIPSALYRDYDLPDISDGGARGKRFAAPGEKDLYKEMGRPGISPNHNTAFKATLRPLDIDFLKRRFPDAAVIEGQMIHWAEIGRAGGKPFEATVEGSTSQGAAVRLLEVAEGRYLSANDVEEAERVCILGSTIAERLFDGRSALGKNISAFGTRWRVVGVLEAKGSLMRFDYDELVILPITAMQERTRVELVNALLIQARDTDAALKIHEELAAAVMHRLPGRRPDEFQVFSQDELVRQREKTLNVFQVLSVSIAAFSLLVSGIGIMNIMLVSVRERMREIGIWKAVGATDGYVLVYFLTESILTCLFGGALGILLGFYLGSEATDLIAGSVSDAIEWTPVFRIHYVAIAFGTSAFVGLLSGIFPAYIAARLEPSAALRYE